MGTNLTYVRSGGLPPSGVEIQLVCERNSGNSVASNERDEGRQRMDFAHGRCSQLMYMTLELIELRS